MKGDRLHVPKIAIPVEPRNVVRGRARFRSRVVAGCVALALCGIAAKGATLCTQPEDRVIADGSSQRWGQVTMRARRGEIFDREGRRLATSVDTPSVAIDPQVLQDKTPEDRHALAIRLAGILSLPEAEVEAKMERSGRFVKLATLIHPKVAAEISDLHERGVWTYRDPHRYYPEETLAAQLLGFVDSEGEGHGGIEETLDENLRGGAYVIQRRRDRKGLDVDRPGGVDSGANEGLDVHTTIDRRIQAIAEDALLDVVEASAPVSAFAVVVDVKTGDVLALANWPTYNPNEVLQDPTPQRNHIVADAIEPGSIFKPFTIAAAVDRGLVTPDTKIDCEGGTWVVGRSRIHDDHPHGTVTIGEVMKYSSNIGTAKLAFKLGADDTLAYLADFGFGRTTGIPLPGERRGKVRDAKTIKPIELATTAFGQGVTATPIQLVMGIATIANGGMRMEPRLVSEVTDAQGLPTYVHPPTEVKQVISPETADAVIQMMEMVTEDGGTGTRARVAGYKVAGKTGTAQKVKDGHYGEARIGSFVGFIPADDPVLAIAVVVDEPSKGSKYGGTVAGPAWSAIAGGALRHLGVMPDPALLDLPEEEDVEPVAELADPEPTPIRLEWDGAGWVVPDLHGRPMRDVLVALEDSGVGLELKGSGSVVSQFPAPGEHVSNGGKVEVTFQ